MMKYYIEGLTRSFCFFIVVTFLFFTPIGLTDEIYITKNIELKISSSSEISKQQEKHFKKEEPKEITKTVNKVNTVKKETNNTVKTSNTIKNEVKETKRQNRIIIPNVLDKDLMKDLNGDNFYLNNNINGKYDGIGVPYIDFRTSFDSRKMIIYAHSSPNGNGPFQPLQKYHNNKDFYNNNKYITIKYDGKTYKYEIFSVYVAAAVDEDSEELEYFYRTYYSDEKWYETLQLYKSKSEYDTGVEVNENDKIIILQTCSMDSKYYRKYYRYNLLVMAKLISVN